MSSNINRSPFLRTTRNFPSEAKELSYEMDKSYLDIASAVNDRTIGIYPTVNPGLTGNSFFVRGQKMQSLRQLFVVPAIAAGGSASIPINSYTAPYIYIGGACITDLPDSRPIPYVSVGGTAGIDIRVDKAGKNIVIIVDAGSPNILSGYIILEWISAV